MHKVALVAASLLASALIVPAASKPMSQRDWSRSVVETQNGDFRMGNPNAKVNLVEYGSLACSHCRAFEQTAYEPLVRSYVRTGSVTYEFRSVLLNAPDIT